MEIDSAFTVISAEMTYQVLDSRWMSIRTHHRFELEATRPHRFYFREYNWDNEKGIEKLPRILSGRQQSGRAAHRLQGPVVSGPNGWRLLVVDLGRILGPGEREVVEIEHFFVRVAPDADGFVGALAREGMERIHLTAILPNRNDLRLHSKHRAGSRDTEEWEHIQMLAGTTEAGSIKVTHKISDPTPGRRYRLGWDQH